MSHGKSSTKSILYALLANLGIAILKTGTAIITGSGSMLAEAIHSYADCGNQGLLFFGLRRAKRPPTPDYPLGYGKAIFFWSFIVALILFSMGGLFSIYEGIHKLHSHEELKSPLVAIIVLIVSILIEGASLFGCLKEIKPLRAKKSLWRWFQESRRSELVVVLAEDIAAILGLLFALTAIIFAVITGKPIFDAIGSIGIGVLLVVISFFIGLKIKGLLIGQSVIPEQREEIQSYLEQSPEIESVLNLITLQLGDQIMVAIKARMHSTESGAEMVKNINLCERDLKEKIPEIMWIFFEPDIHD